METEDLNYGAARKLSSVVCLRDQWLWICYTYHDTMIKLNLYRRRGHRQATEVTRSGQNPYDIAVLRVKLVYTDSNSRCIEIVEREAGVLNRREIILLRGWIPQGVCSTRSDDLLVIMKSHGEDDQKTRVVRYTYFGIRVRTIQWDARGQPLYSSGYYKYRAENRKGDICVADCDANVVVVVKRMATTASNTPNIPVI